MPKRKQQPQQPTASSSGKGSAAATASAASNSKKASKKQVARPSTTTTAAKEPTPKPTLASAAAAKSPPSKRRKATSGKAASSLAIPAAKSTKSSTKPKPKKGGKGARKKGRGKGTKEVETLIPGYKSDYVVKESDNKYKDIINFDSPVLAHLDPRLLDENGPTLATHMTDEHVKKLEGTMGSKGSKLKGWPFDKRKIIKDEGKFVRFCIDPINS